MQTDRDALSDDEDDKFALTPRHSIRLLPGQDWTGL